MRGFVIFHHRGQYFEEEFDIPGIYVFFPMRATFEMLLVLLEV